MTQESTPPIIAPMFVLSTLMSILLEQKNEGTYFRTLEAELGELLGVGEDDDLMHYYALVNGDRFMQGTHENLPWLVVVIPLTVSSV